MDNVETIEEKEKPVPETLPQGDGIGDAKTRPQEKSRKKRGVIRTFLRWFFRLLLLVIVLCAVFVALVLRLPQKWGWVKSPAEKAFDATVDRSGAEELTVAVEAAGLSVEGTEFYLLPLKDSDKNVAYAVLDSSQGFRFGASSQEGQEGSDPMIGTMIALARSQATKNLKVERVAIEYRDESGKPLATMTADTQHIIDFADKKISREEFIKSVDGRMEIRNVIERSLISF